MTLVRQWQKNHNISLTCYYSSIIRTWSAFILLGRLGCIQFMHRAVLWSTFLLAVVSLVKYTSFLKLKLMKSNWRCAQSPRRSAGFAGNQQNIRRWKTAVWQPAACIPAHTPKCGSEQPLLTLHTYVNNWRHFNLKVKEFSELVDFGN